MLSAGVVFAVRDGRRKVLFGHSLSFLSKCRVHVGGVGNNAGLDKLPAGRGDDSLAVPRGRSGLENSIANAETPDRAVADAVKNRLHIIGGRELQKRDNGARLDPNAQDPTDKGADRAFVVSVEQGHALRRIEVEPGRVQDLEIDAAGIAAANPGVRCNDGFDLSRSFVEGRGRGLRLPGERPSLRVACHRHSLLDRGHARRRRRARRLYR